MRTIEIKNIYGDVLFSHTAENNSITLTVEAAVSCGVSLSKANLAGACLAWADLDGADLEGADLEGADLEGANLRNTSLKKADLAGQTSPGLISLMQTSIGRILHKQTFLMQTFTILTSKMLYLTWPILSVLKISLTFLCLARRRVLL